MTKRLLHRLALHTSELPGMGMRQIKLSPSKEGCSVRAWASQRHEFSVPNANALRNAQKTYRLDSFLSENLPTVSRARIQESVKAGTAFVNGVAQVKPAFKLRPGDQVECEICERPALDVEPENIALDVTYEDEDVIVVNKAAGMVVHPAPGNYTGTLVNAILYHCNLPKLVVMEEGSAEDIAENLQTDSDDIIALELLQDSTYGNIPVPRPGIVHRLDKGTSGLMVVAKTDDAKESLQRQFSERTVERRYMSLTCGTIIGERKGKVLTNIGRDLRERTRMATFAVNDSSRTRLNLKRAVSNYEVHECFANGGASLVIWRLETGRTHQIRVHAKHLGIPLVADETYGGSMRKLNSSLSRMNSPASAKMCTESVMSAIKRPALHAATLGFEHPKTGKRMLFKREPPEDFSSALNILKCF